MREAITSEREQKVERIFHDALNCEDSEREAFLIIACGNDTSLREEVERLIAFSKQAESFMESPAFILAAKKIAAEREAELLREAKSLVGKCLNQYKIVDLLGRGGMGNVYRAADTRLKREVAIKILPSIFATDESLLRRFQQEARAASALNHPNILTVYDFGEVNSTHYIVTELIAGVTLRERMEREPIKLLEALSIAIQVASALAAAHAVGIVHRDIKPGNIMLHRDGYVKILDFGIAKFTEEILKQEGAASVSSNSDYVHTKTGLAPATPQYASPEQLQTPKDVDKRTDIWSLGVVLYEMVAGSPPFKGSPTTNIKDAVLYEEPLPLTHFSPDVPVELQWIVMKALRKDREQRYQTVKDMLIDLNQLKHDLENDEDYLKLFIGEKYRYYLREWKKMEKSSFPISSFSGFNWGAFLGGPAWLFYRKMYSYGILYLCIVHVMWIIEVELSLRLPWRDPNDPKFLVTGITLFDFVSDLLRGSTQVFGTVVD